MMSEILMNNQEIKRDYELASLMILYAEGNLGEQDSLKMKELIENCEECALMYGEVKEFCDFDGIDTMAYRILKEESYKISKIKLDQCIESSPINIFNLNPAE